MSQNNATEFCAYPSGQRMYRGTREYSVPQEDNGFEIAGKNAIGGHHLVITQVPGFMVWGLIMIG